MNQSIYRISLDIHSVASQLSLGVNRGDNMRRLIITLTENGKTYEITDDCYAIFTTVKPDGNSIANDCTIKDNTIIYDFTEQTTAVAGTLDCSVILYNSKGEQLTSPRCTVIVYETTHQNIELTSTDEYSSLIDLQSRLYGDIEALEKDLAMGVYNGKDGEKGSSIYSVADGYVILANPSVGQTTSFDWEDHMTTGSALMGDSVVDGLGNVYIALAYGASPTVQFTGVNIKGERGVGIPNGGTAGQILTKTESGTAWENAPSGGGSGGGEYYICSPLVNGADTYASEGSFILLPPESSCSKIELIDVVYIRQPRCATPYTTRITLNWVLYDKSGGSTTQYGYIPYQQGDTDGSGNLHDSSVYFTYSSYYGLFGGYASPETDGYESVRTSCFRFKITM
jgi:hypothetical protein